MLGVILLILSIIGRVLLVILAVVLILLALILFLPILYQAQAAKEDDISASARAVWFFGLLKAVFVLQKDGDGYQPHIQLKIGGHILYDNQRKPDEKKKAGSVSGKREKQGRQQEASAPHSRPASLPMSGKEQPGMGSFEESPDQDISPDQNISLDQNMTSAKGESGIRGKIKTFFSRIREKFSDLGEKIADRLDTLAEKIFDRFFSFWEKAASVTDKLSSIDDKKEAFMVLLDDEKNRKWLSRSLFRIKRLLICIRPHFEEFYLNIGTGDPSQTGLLLGALGAVYPLCPDVFDLDPDFDREVFKGRVRLHGHVMTASLLFYILPIVLNKTFFSLLKKVKAMRSSGR